MAEIMIYPAGTGAAVGSAVSYLKRWGISITDHPQPEITHLLLDVPSGEVPLKLLERLPEDITIVGGFLKAEGYRTLDLLQNEHYLAGNAAITAECAIQVTMEHSSQVLTGTTALVIGWGRIGKCLAFLLRQLGCLVTVAARKESDRAMAKALGFDVCTIDRIRNPGRFSLLYNTVPASVLGEEILSGCPDTLKIDLASIRGLMGLDVLWARGLPGRYAPDSSGRLIAETILKEVTA